MRVPFLLTLLCYLVYRWVIYTTGASNLALLVFLLPVLILLLHLVLRRRLKYKAWFLNKSNFLLERLQKESVSDIPGNLLFEKLKEVLEDSDFELLDSDSQTLQLLASTSINFWTWGENIYINILPQNERSRVVITSVSIFGGVSWNRNQKNHEHFYRSFEESLII